MYSDVSSAALPALDFSIRKSPDQSPFDGSPRLIAAYYVLRRLLVPRYPSYSLNSLTIWSNLNFCAVIKEQLLHYISYIMNCQSNYYCDRLPYDCLL